jgi:DNA polymerase bacteriophage-type
MLAVYDIRWSAPKILLSHEIPAFLAQYPAPETICCSHNALFDLAILSWKYGWVAGLMQDTLGMCRALRNFKRNSLEAVVKEMFHRDTDKSLMGKVIGMRVQDIKQAGFWPAMCTYAMNDCRECAHIYFKLYPEFPAEERLVMDMVLRAAVVPRLHADVPLLENHLNTLRATKTELLRKCGYDKAALMSAQKFQEALLHLGIKIELRPAANLLAPPEPFGLKKSHTTNNWIPAFAKTDPFMVELQEHEDFRVQTLVAARLSQKSTIEETRAQRFLNIAKLPWGNGALLPVALRYGGAHTHRLSGEWKLNMQNLPRDKTKSKLRTALKAPPGEKLITGDLAQIEARIVATLTREYELIEAFRRGDDVYAQFASKIFKRTITKKDNPSERFIGKTCILGLGYGCGIERFSRMVITQARQFNVPGADPNGVKGLFDKDTARDAVKLYRESYKRIPATWAELDRHLNDIITNIIPNLGTKWPDSIIGPLTFTSGRVTLPNDMTLRYKLDDHTVWGGHLLENITQALARIIIMQAAIRLAHKGLRWVLQAHDELVFSVPNHQVKESREIISQEMTRAPPWLPGLPLAVEIGEGDNYGECK